MQWVEPELVAQVRFVEWTAERLLRLVSSPRSLTQVIVEIASNLALTAGDAPTEGPPVGRQMRPTTHLRLEAEWKQGETAMAKARRKSPTSSTKSESQKTCQAPPTWRPARCNRSPEAGTSKHRDLVRGIRKGLIWRTKQTLCQSAFVGLKGT